MSIEKTYSYSMRPVISSARKLMTYKYDRDVQVFDITKSIQTPVFQKSFEGTDFLCPERFNVEIY